MSKHQNSSLRGAYPPYKLNLSFCCVFFLLSFFLAFLFCCLCQNPALAGTWILLVPLIVTDLFLELKILCSFFSFILHPLSSLQLLLRLLRLMKVNWPVPFLLYLQQIRALLGVFIFFIFIFYFCCSLYRVCGCWANSCGSVLTKMFLL